MVVRVYMHERRTGEDNYAERSLEYRNILKLKIRTVREIEQNYADFTIGANVQMAQMLVFKEAGYVRKPFKDVFVYGYGSPHEEIRPYPGLENIDILKTVWIAQTEGDYDYLSFYPIGSKDEILKEIWVGDRRMTLFRGGYSVDWVARSVVGG